MGFCPLREPLRLEKTRLVKGEVGLADAAAAVILRGRVSMANEVKGLSHQDAHPFVSKFT